jgi:hypothetical protein
MVQIRTRRNGKRYPLYIRDPEDIQETRKELDRIEQFMNGYIPGHSHEGMQQTEWCPYCQRYLKREDLP